VRRSSKAEKKLENEVLSTGDVAVKRRLMAPMTKEEWERQQNAIHRVVDVETGRSRLVKGSGEILEEIISKDQQKKINKASTAGDGLYYQLQAGLLDYNG